MVRLWTDKKRKRSQMDSPSPDREPNVWDHKPPETFKRTATSMAHIAAQSHRFTWTAHDEMHHNLMTDIKQHTRETFLEGKKHGCFIREQDVIVLRSKWAEAVRDAYEMRLKYNVLEAKYDECKKRLAACDYVHMADDDFMELLISSEHLLDPDPYLPDDSPYR